MCPEQAANCSETAWKHESSLIWHCLFNQWCKIGWDFINLSYTLTAFMKMVCFIVFKLCKSVSSWVLWKNIPTTCTLYVALIIQCHSTEDVLWCLFAVLIRSSWENHWQSLVLLEENCSSAWAEDLNKALCSSEHYRGLKYHSILQCLDPPVTVYSITHRFQTVLLLALHSTEVAFTYLSQVKQMPRIVCSKKNQAKNVHLRTLPFWTVKNNC